MHEKNSVTIRLRDQAATARLARALSKELKAGDIVALHGDLGVGKTTFARALIFALTGDEEVPSPTFSLVQIYEPKNDLAAAPIWHFDLYRLEQPAEALELGIEEAFDQGISLIEWPERLGGFMPKNHLQLELGFGDNQNERLATIRGGPSWGERLAQLVTDFGSAERV